MNTNDLITAQSVKLAGQIRLIDREITTKDAVTTLVLFGRPCLQLNHRTGEVKINGYMPTTRKSCRVMNAVLQHIGKPPIRSRNGQWLHETPTGTIINFTRRTLII